MNHDFPIFKKFLWDLMENCTNSSLIDLDFKTITSPEFEIPLREKITKWHLALTTQHNVISLDLIRKDSNQLNFNVLFSLSIYEKEGEFLTKNSFRRGGENFEVNEFLSEYSLVVNLCDDCMRDRNYKICCEMIIISKKKTEELQLLPSLSSDMQKMYEMELFTDFEFRCSDGVSVKCHKSVLAARSPVFEAMLSNEMEETREGFVEVPDYNSNLMKEFLRFIYCGNVQNIEELAKDLIFLADKYDIEGLKEICINSCIKDLSKANVVENLQIVDKVSGCNRLFEESVGFIGGDFTEISKTEGWKELSDDMLKKLAMLEDTKFENLK